MKQENYNYLKKFDDNMITASKAGYSRNISRKEIKRIVEIYKEETGREYNDNPYCSGCMVNILTELKGMYDSHRHKVDDTESIIEYKEKTKEK